jgi:hypothetical protein
MRGERDRAVELLHSVAAKAPRTWILKTLDSYSKIAPLE